MGWICLFVAGRCGLRARPVRCGPGCGPGYVKICGAGCGPNDTVAGRVRAQPFQPAQFLSKFAHCLCLLVGGLPDSSFVCVCVCECVRACVRVCGHACVCACGVCTLCVACTTACVRRIFAVHAWMCSYMCACN